MEDPGAESSTGMDRSIMVLIVSSETDCASGGVVSPLSDGGSLWR